MSDRAAPRLLVNCDIGERGADHPVDAALMRLIDIANIACGGHAGDPESVAAFVGLARRLGVRVSAHLSYPDRARFGRASLELRADELERSLAGQYSLMRDVPTVKFHGALYNDTCRHPELAGRLAQWLRTTACTCLLAPDDSAIARACRAAGIGVLTEAFAERRYCVGSDRTGGPVLVDRSLPYACIEECGEAVRQAIGIEERGEVDAVVQGCAAGGHDGLGDAVAQAAGALPTRRVPLRAETICIHSDSPIALCVAERLAERPAERHHRTGRP